MVDSSNSRHIQLTHLPSLEEINHEVKETAGERILSKAVALQLKPMNAEISKFAFDYLMLLIEDQLNDMIGFLHKSSNIQRRELIAKVDLELFLEGFNISPTDLELQWQISQHYGKIYGSEMETLHSLREVTSVGAIENEGISQEVVNALVPPSNPLMNIVPKWLPALPPDHTYRFTPQYNRPITDETLIRRKIVEEGKQSEVALLHLLQTSDAPVAVPEVEMSPADEELAFKESMAIYGNMHKRRRKQASSSSDLLSKLPQANFSVEEYARNRVELARRKVIEYEEKQLHLQQNPFIKYSNLIVSASSENANRRHINGEIQSMLKRSLYSLVKSIPQLQETKQEARRVAEKARDERLQELRAQREEQNRDDERLQNEDLNLLDLGDNSDDFFNYSGSDNDNEGQENEENSTAMITSVATHDATPIPQISVTHAVATDQEVTSNQEVPSLATQTQASERKEQAETAKGPEMALKEGNCEDLNKGESKQLESEQQITKEVETAAAADEQLAQDDKVEERHQQQAKIQEKEFQQPERAQERTQHDEEEGLELDNTDFLFNDNDDFDGGEVQF